MEVAERLGDVSILSVDSMTVYAEMDIGTAKATARDRARVPHHLLDLVDPAEEFSVADFQGFARDALATCAAEGRRALLVGGTGLYHRAVIDDLDLPGQFAAVAAHLADRLAVEGLSALYAELAALDPTAAAKMEPTNERRILRALEVCLGSGRPFSSFGPGLSSYDEVRTVQIGLAVDRTALASSIEARVDRFVERGFVGEVERLASRPRGLSRTARQAVGYRELLGALEGTCTVEAAIAETVIATRQLARRQWAWFRRDPRICWVPRSEIVDVVCAALDGAPVAGRMAP
jgi:tRNA dimethylallyltransferase